MLLTKLFTRGKLKRAQFYHNSTMETKISHRLQLHLTDVLHLLVLFADYCSFTIEFGRLISSIIFLFRFVLFSGYKDGWLHAWATESGKRIASFNAHLPVLEVLTSREAHRIVLRLDQCPKLAIVCLHNCPAFADSDAARRRKRSRALSISSLGSM